MDSNFRLVAFCGMQSPKPLPPQDKVKMGTLMGMVPPKPVNVELPGLVKST